MKKVVMALVVLSLSVAVNAQLKNNPAQQSRDTTILVADSLNTISVNDLEAMRAFAYGKLSKEKYDELSEYLIFLKTITRNKREITIKIK